LTDPALAGPLPLRLELKASPRLAAVIVALHAAAAWSFLTVLTGWPGSLLAALTVLLGSATAWDRALLRSQQSPKRVEIHSGGTAKCLFANGDSGALQRLGGIAVTRYWVACGLAAPGRRTLFVAADMLAPAALRTLRLWVLWGKLPGVAFAQAAPDSR